MVDFALSPKQLELRKNARAFCDENIRPVARAHDLSGEFPMGVVQKAYDAQLVNGLIPKEYGGVGHTAFDAALASEELGAACAGIGICIDANNLALTPIYVGGNDAQKKKFFGELIEKRGLASFCLSEPDAGSDAGAQKTTAVKKGDKYILNGMKHYSTNGCVADLLTVFCSTDPSKGARGTSCIVVPTHLPGIKMGKTLDKMGQRASCQVEWIFENVEVPAENLLGKEGMGFIIAMKTLDRTRAGVAALSVGVAREAYEVSSKYAMNRVQFGQPVSSFQAIAFMFADMYKKIELSRLATWKAAWASDTGSSEIGTLSSIAKLFASDTAMEVTTDAVQVMGGAGYSREHIVEKLMRDAKLLQIYEGTNQIQRLVISRNILK
jgi:alkylation response protein AidB-like acyl-CoA dehydrogenase